MSEENKFIVGFRGWYVYANIVFAVILVVMILLPTMEGLPLILMGIWFPTIIKLIVLFKKKEQNAKNTAIGMLIAMISNMIIAGIYSGAFVQMLTGHFPTGMLMPIPGMLIAVVMAVMDMLSPPYTNMMRLISG